MEYRYKPFIVSAEFDEKPEKIDGDRWIAGAAVDLGDANGPRFKDSRSRIERLADDILFGKGHRGNPASLGYQFTFFVCSPEFKRNPTDLYGKYAHIMYTQDKYDATQARRWLEEKVNSIGEVSESELTKILHTFLESEDWDFDQKGSD